MVKQKEWVTWLLSERGQTLIPSAYILLLTLETIFFFHSLTVPLCLTLETCCDKAAIKLAKLCLWIVTSSASFFFYLPLPVCLCTLVRIFIIYTFFLSVLIYLLCPLQLWLQSISFFQLWFSKIKQRKIIRKKKKLIRKSLEPGGVWLLSRQTPPERLWMLGRSCNNARGKNNSSVVQRCRHTAWSCTAERQTQNRLSHWAAFSQTAANYVLLNATLR